MTCCGPFFVSFLFLLFVCSLIPSPPPLCRYLLALLGSCCFCPCNSSYLLRFVRATASRHLRVVLSVQQSVPLQHVWGSSGQLQPSRSFPIFLDHISSEHLSFVLFCVVFLFPFFLFFFLFFFSFSFFLFSLSWAGLCCCVLLPGMLRSTHLLYLDGLRLFGLLCFAESVTTEFVSL